MECRCRSCSSVLIKKNGHIPELASVAFKQGCWSALPSCSSALISKNGDLVEVFPSGTHKLIKDLPEFKELEK